MDVDSSTKFIGSLTKFLQSLCNGYVEFQRGVELCGHIYLSIDTGEKVDYILHEKVSKNDENSVTFVSNSFHAQPLADQDKNKTAANKDKDKSGMRSSRDESDDDLMIVEQSRGAPGSTNSGTIPSRGIKRISRDNQGSNNQFSSPVRSQQKLGSSASMTSQDTHQDGINIGDVKLEQMSTAELLSLASQVGEGTSPTHGHGPPVKAQVRRRSLGETAGQPVWIKQEAPDDPHGGPDAGSGWSHSRDGQSDSSNSGSNLYPVMMHPNAAAFSSSPVFPGFPSMSGPSASATSQHHASGQPLPGTSGGGHPYPMMGSSHNMSGIDPAGCDLQMATKQKQRQYNKDYWQRLKADPERYARRIEYIREVNRRARMRKKLWKSMNS